MFVTEFFKLKNIVFDTETKFDEVGYVVFMDKYSRIKSDGKKESWNDVVIRVVNGVISGIKTHYKKFVLEWNENEWQKKARRMAELIYDLKLLPSGRNLATQGTNVIQKCGSIALNNCAFINLNHFYDSEKDLCLASNLSNMMNLLMLGVGVGIKLEWNGNVTTHIRKFKKEIYIIEDSREGWYNSTKDLIIALINGNELLPKFDYTKIRSKGAKISSFNGTASGPDPLIKLHKRIIRIFDKYVNKELYTKTIFLADLVNVIEDCIVSGNIRRSAAILLGSPHDNNFIELKNMKERKKWSYHSNNSVVFNESKDFNMIPKISKHLIDNDMGEPGFINMKNINKFGRYGEKHNDPATGCNPCGEIPLESYELCNLITTFPTKCVNFIGKFEFEQWKEVLYYANLYAFGNSLIPTSIPEINKVIAKNHRIGISISGVAEWIDNNNMSEIINWLREGYKYIKEYNLELSQNFGVYKSIRVTTIKPDGTLGLLAGVSPGIHYPIAKYAIRRIIISKDNPIVSELIKQNVEYEDSIYDSTAYVFKFYIKYDTRRDLNSVSSWEQFVNLETFQREWADNMISCTITYNEEEKPDIEKMISKFMPTIKSVSLMLNMNKKITLDDYIKLYETTDIKTINLFKLSKFDEIKIIIDNLKNIITIMENIYSDDEINRLKQECSILENIYIKYSPKYKQLPFEPISKKYYIDHKKHIDISNFKKGKNITVDAFCTNDKCMF